MRPGSRRRGRHRRAARGARGADCGGGGCGRGALRRRPAHDVRRRVAGSRAGPRSSECRPCRAGRSGAGPRRCPRARDHDGAGRLDRDAPVAAPVRAAPPGTCSGGCGVRSNRSAWSASEPSSQGSRARCWPDIPVRSEVFFYVSAYPIGVVGSAAGLVLAVERLGRRWGGKVLARAGVLAAVAGGARHLGPRPLGGSPRPDPDVARRESAGRPRSGGVAQSTRPAPGLVRTHPRAGRDRPGRDAARGRSSASGGDGTGCAPASPECLWSSRCSSSAAGSSRRFAVPRSGQPALVATTPPASARSRPSPPRSCS